MSNDPLAEIRASFFVECDELLESLQDALGLMESEEHDSETINIVFRAVHSIKGGAGAFGLDTLVAFAHRYETVMDEVRGGRLEASPDVIKLLFKAADTLQDHVRSARDGEDSPSNSEDVLTDLEGLLGADFQHDDGEVDFQPSGLSFDFDADGSAPEELLPAEQIDECGWKITFTPDARLYTSGNETLLLLRSLSALGPISVECIIPDDLAAPSEANAETPSLSWEVLLKGDVTEPDIRQVFDFVADVCQIDIERAQLDEFHEDDRTLEKRGSYDQTTPPDPPGAAAGQLPHASEMDTVSATPAKSTTPRKPLNAASLQPTELSATVRVDLEKIDRLVNLVGELVINQAMLAQSVEEAGIGTQPDVMSGLESFMMLTRDIQESVMMIRAQPVKSLFQRMGRIVREASSSLGKDVRLRTEGEYTEVDKTVIERLADPLTHMIRNAVDHGLETPEDRLAAGKPREGLINLSATHRAGRVLIEIEDDGAGINREKVRHIAVTKGLIGADAQLSDSDTDNLLFLPGFSTATEVSALSGRGVGMDVVKSAITALGGRITINSTPGTGTRFSISLPLTLAVLDGMVVQAAGQTLVVPLSAIVETAKLDNRYIQRLSAAGEMMQIRGDFVPLLDLGCQLGFRQKRNADKAGIVLLTSQDDCRRAALIVDAIMEQRQVVIKGLGQSYGNIPGVAAATILGDGQIALILDPADLAQNSGQPTVNDFRITG
ncbi:chemotaxis protein CheA [Paracoccus albus]|uniref:chemotaxis protein CheA n=1 Tax=Paracoccus albus TaxID=3017784 RepID=UPI0022F10DE2|nr:chemotaxis protein CheA [Paracoccus albus]WBU61224.1 chemotaxis protein CheA [Paracoccus albus]